LALVFYLGMRLTTTWPQDLKDFVRTAGEVTYADVDREGRGVVDFESNDDVANAIRKLDGIELKGKRVELSEDANATINPPPPPMRSRDRSRSPSGRGGYGGRGGFDRGGYDRRRSPPPRYGGYSDRPSPPRYPPADRSYPPAASRQDDVYPPRNGAGREEYVPQRRSSPRYDDRASRRPPFDPADSREPRGRDRDEYRGYR